MRPSAPPEEAMPLNSTTNLHQARQTGRHFMAYSLPDLPYAYDALEPHIDARTMEIHHSKHHNAYISKVNAALEGTGIDKSIEDLVSDLNAVPEALGQSLTTNVSCQPIWPRPH
jgi:superoxide dismutase